MDGWMSGEGGGESRAATTRLAYAVYSPECVADAVETDDGNRD